MTAQEWAEERVREILGGCTCTGIYKTRKLSAPDCSWCSYGKEFAAALIEARSEGERSEREAAEATERKVADVLAEKHVCTKECERETADINEGCRLRLTSQIFVTLGHQRDDRALRGKP